ncbi:MAG: tRNA (adenosine(37)-N6)-threonylcarbamoyltransferase complex dimerization subunit type 1 TsaB [Pseudomonadota bacterium]
MILGLTTAGSYCAVALLAQGRVVAAKHESLAKGQSERLFPMTAEVLEEGGVRYQDLDAIGVSAGPGNFTGIRISIAAARGLALGLGIPSVAVSTLEALALDHSGPLLASITAGRGHYFCQRFGKAARGPALVPVDAVAQWHLPGLRCIGDDADALAATLGATSLTAPPNPALAIARIAADRWQDDPPRPAPLYLRPADAAPARDAPPPVLP